MSQATLHFRPIQRALAPSGENAYSLPMNSITTPRLRLLSATADFVRLEIGNRDEFFKELGVLPALDWPSANLARALPFFLEQLENDPSSVGWMAWYWIYDTQDNSQLIGGGGFKGSPTDGMVEIGYETRSAYRGQGFATEAVGAQVTWALKQTDVNVVIAETRADNKGSIAVLRNLGFGRVGPGSEANLLRFESEICGR